MGGVGVSAVAHVLPRELRAHDGSDEITVWCPCCVERTVPGRNGCCMWCDTPLTDEAIDRNGAPTIVEPGLVIAPGPDGFYHPTTDLPPLPAPRSPKVAKRRVGRTTSVEAPARETPSGTQRNAKVCQLRVPRRRKRNGNRHRRAYSDEQILARIRLWAEVVGSPPSKADWNPAKVKGRLATARGHVERHLRRIALYEMGDFPSETLIRSRFGSMNAALVQAGYEPRSAGRQPTTGQGIGKPKIGRRALEEYIEAVQANLDGDQVALKASLYQLAMSAFWWADGMAGEEVA